MTTSNSDAVVVRDLEKRFGRFVAVDIDPPLMGNLRTVTEAMEANDFEEMERGKTGFRTLFIPMHYVSGLH